MKLNAQRWWSQQEQDDNEFASNYPSSKYQGTLKKQREAYSGLHKGGRKKAGKKK